MLSSIVFLIADAIKIVVCLSHRFSTKLQLLVSARSAWAEDIPDTFMFLTLLLKNVFTCDPIKPLLPRISTLLTIYSVVYILFKPFNHYVLIEENEFVVADVVEPYLDQLPLFQL